MHWWDLKLLPSVVLFSVLALTEEVGLREDRHHSWDLVVLQNKGEGVLQMLGDAHSPTSDCVHQMQLH